MVRWPVHWTGIVLILVRSIRMGRGIIESVGRVARRQIWQVHVLSGGAHPRLRRARVSVDVEKIKRGCLPVVGECRVVTGAVTTSGRSAGRRGCKEAQVEEMTDIPDPQGPSNGA